MFKQSFTSLDVDFAVLLYLYRLTNRMKNKCRKRHIPDDVTQGNNVNRADVAVTEY